ncbi:hypothetical protein [Colwellia sp. BRX10-4]|jgi:hypothetical protein|uniref:hypothetical protein n=1 Tax=Colwellia sp. BRX10-4 TaxID=2759843 RepID=UPI0015F6E403|nr:hypothetical protein [Colwellia sp. BRX10-4]MBA6399917.1 hypothetical protein [Colwellia sp. BRX10-4]
MDWLKRHKDEIIKLTIVSVISLIIFNILMAGFDWTVLNVPILVDESGSFLSKTWVAYVTWGEEAVTIQQSKFTVLSLFLTMIFAVIQLFFWGFNRKYKRNQ